MAAALLPPTHISEQYRDEYIDVLCDFPDETELYEPEITPETIERGQRILSGSMNRFISSNREGQKNDGSEPY